MQFEWDETKRLLNLDKHGFDFNRATQIFDGRPILTIESHHEREKRWLSTAAIADRYYTVVWTERNGAIRIISARRARDGERRAYRAVHG